MYSSSQDTVGLLLDGFANSIIMWYMCTTIAEWHQKQPVHGAFCISGMTQLPMQCIYVFLKSNQCLKKKENLKMDFSSCMLSGCVLQVIIDNVIPFARYWIIVVHDSFQLHLSCNRCYWPSTASRKLMVHWQNLHSCSSRYNASMNWLSFPYGVKGRRCGETLNSLRAQSGWEQLQRLSCCCPHHAVAANHLSRPSDTNTTRQTTGLDCYVNDPVMLIL